MYREIEKIQKHNMYDYTRYTLEEKFVAFV